MIIKKASLMGAEAMGRRVLTVGGFFLASLGVCAAADAVQKAAKPSDEVSAVKKEVVTGALPETTIMANRTETDLSKVGSSVTVLDAKELQKQGVSTLRDALKFVPGVVSVSTSGQRGSYGTLLVRGMTTKYTHMVVDGMRVSDGNFGMGNLLGTGNIGGLSRIEMLRGPQGSLYGGESIGGVLGLFTAKGEGDLSSTLRLEGGSFNSWNGMLGIQGAEGDFAYSLSLGYERTDNDVPNNDFEMFSYALRLDYSVNDSFEVGFTLRGSDSSLMQPDYTKPATYPHISDVDFKSTVATLFADYQVNDIWSSKLTLGVYNQDYFIGYTPVAPSWYNDYSNDFTKYAAYWDNTLKWNDQHTTVVGAVYEFTNAKTKDRTRKQHGFFANHIWDVTEQLNLTGGIRWEDYNDYGNVFTWHLSTAYTLEQTQTIFRANVGKGFRAPTFYEMDHVYPGVKSIDSESSIGWDIGIEQPWCDGQYKVSVVYFENAIDDAMVFKSSGPPTWTGGYVNVDGTSRTSGIEASAEGHFLDDRLVVALSYTWMNEALVDTPDNVVALRVHGEITDSLNAGVTASYLDSRTFGAYGNTNYKSLDSYILVNCYANYQVTENVAFNARVENLLNTDYEYGQIYGSVAPGRGIGFFGGVTLSF